MPISICLYSFGNDLLHILIGRLYYTVHLGSEGYRVMILDLEPNAYLCHHVIVQVETIVRYDSLRKSISSYNFSLDEMGYH